MASNPFEDLVPAKQRKEDNPFADLLPEEELDYDFDAVQMIKNIPSSAGKLAGDIYNAVTNPIDTAGALVDVGKGVASKGARVWQGAATGVPYDSTTELMDESMADAAGEALKDRYGGIEEIQRTLTEDPVGAAVDLSGAGALAGRVAGVSRLARGAAALDPIQQAGKAVSAVAKRAVPKGAPQRLYQSAAKFSTTLDPVKRQRLIQKAMDEGLMPTSKGVGKLQDRVTLLNEQMDDIILSATTEGVEIPVGVVFQHLKELRKTRGGVRLGSDKDLAKINEIAGRFHRSLEGRKTVTPEELQKFKKEAYKDIAWDAKRQAGTPVKEDTYKAMARGAREGLEQVDPAIKGVNQELGNLLELQPHLQRSANRIDNLNMMGLSTPLRGGAGAVIGEAAGSAGTGIAAGLASALIDNPAFKAKAAMILNRIQKQDVQWLQANATQAEIQAAIAMTGRNEEVQEQQ